MDITTTTTQTSAAATRQPESAKKLVSSDFETFLKMLTAQMENQDPLNPVDSQDFATQLATFSGVEQQVKTNDLLTALSDQMALSSLGEMATWVGREARLTVPASFNGSPVEIAPSPPAYADAAELVAFNAKGEEVQRLRIPVGDEPVLWAGVDEKGNPFPSGTYSFKVDAISNGEVIESQAPDIFATVSEVRLLNGSPVVVLADGTTHPSKAVSGLR